MVQTAYSLTQQQGTDNTQTNTPGFDNLQEPGPILAHHLTREIDAYYQP